MVEAEQVKRVTYDSGTVEALKWFALVLMVVDHINKYVFHEHYKIAFGFGRLCLPIFAILLAYGLAQPDSLESGRYIRVLRKLLIAGALTIPLYWGLGVPFYILNILFMFAVGTLCIWLIDEGTTAYNIIAALVFIVASAFVEYWWLGVAIMLSSWFYFRNPTLFRASVVVLSVASLALINRNLYALAALPLLYFSRFVSIPIPRVHNFFYYFFPAHLTVIYLVTLAV